MRELPETCACPICLAEDQALYVAPLASIKAVRERRQRREAHRTRCPRCDAYLGLTEVVVDSADYAHFVQPCADCAALWVL